MRNETEFTVRADTGEYAKGPNNIIRKLAGYSSQTLQAQIDLTTKSLGMAAAAIDTSNDGDLRRWNRLAKLAAEVTPGNGAMVRRRRKRNRKSSKGGGTFGCDGRV